MDFSLLFDRIELEHQKVEHYPKDSLFHSLFIYQDDFPSLEDIDLVLFSIDDNRATTNSVLDASKIRESLYQLKKGHEFIKIADIGCLRPGPNYSDTMDRLQEVLSFLLQNQIVPIVLNSSQDVVTDAYKVLANAGLEVNVGLVDAQIDFEGAHRNDHYIDELLAYEAPKLSRLKLLGYQSYRVSKKLSSVFQKLSFEELRLGEIKRDVFLAEPYLRNCHLISFDMRALKSTDFPANGVNSPFGLTTEEACQLSWFAGHATDLKGVFFSNYLEDQDHGNLSAYGLSVVIWHFMEGYYSNIKEDFHQHATQYLVSNEGFAEDLKFIKSTKSNKWWMEISGDLIPCTYQDYLDANQGLIPDVWLREVTK